MLRSMGKIMAEALLSAEAGGQGWETVRGVISGEAGEGTSAELRGAGDREPGRARWSA